MRKGVNRNAYLLVIVGVALILLLNLRAPSTGKAGESGTPAVLSIAVDDNQLLVGDTLTVSVLVSNVQNLYGYQYDLMYNGAVLNFLSASPGPFLAEGGMSTFFSQPKSAPGMLDDVAESRTGATAASSTNGVLTTFTFTVIGTGSGDLQIVKPMLSTPDANAIPVTISGTTFTGVQCVDVDYDTYGTFCPAGPDCDDGNAAVNPGRTEVPYNTLDDDCNAATLDDDLDGDGFVLAQDCSVTDNRESDPMVNPNMVETPYNGIDDDCNALTKDNDLDGDGYAVGGNLATNDCRDDDPTIHPLAEDPPYDGIDQDCSGADPNDLDGDGYLLAQDCSVTDNRDNDPTINPGKTETPYNGKDDDCNVATLDDDLDTDGFTQINECDDANAAVNPNQPEQPYNGIDDNCNGLTDEGCPIGDVNRDRIVDIFDLAAIEMQFGEPAASNPALDLKQDATAEINIFDVVLAARDMGLSC